MLRIIQPSSLEDAVRAVSASPSAELKAGGTDVVDRARRRGFTVQEVVSVDRLLDATIDVGPSGMRIGAGATLASLIESEELVRRFPVLAAAVRATATPQIRARATVGGALCQRPRCVYLRHPDYVCAKEGGGVCYARFGENRYHAVFDNDACVAVHPSTVGAALLALDARLRVLAPGGARLVMDMVDFFSVSPSDPSRENALAPGSMVESVEVPFAVGTTRQSYFRLASRERAEWADVEAAVALVLDGARIMDARVVLGGVGRVPRRAVPVEQALVGRPLRASIVAGASSRAAEGARPLAHNGAKIEGCKVAVQAALEELL